MSTDSDIKEALQTKTYTIEYLYSKLGNHARKNGLADLNLQFSSSTIGAQDYKNLTFTVNGKYLQVISFISDIENDSDLDFTIDNFSMTKDNAKFTVKDLKLEGDLTTSQTEASTTSTSTTPTDTSSSSSVVATPTPEPTTTPVN